MQLMRAHCRQVIDLEPNRLVKIVFAANRRTLSLLLLVLACALVLVTDALVAKASIMLAENAVSQRIAELELDVATGKISGVQSAHSGDSLSDVAHLLQGPTERLSDIEWLPITVDGNPGGSTSSSTSSHSGAAGGPVLLASSSARLPDLSLTSAFASDEWLLLTEAVKMDLLRPPQTA